MKREWVGFPMASVRSENRELAGHLAAGQPDVPVKG